MKKNLLFFICVIIALIVSRGIYTSDKFQKEDSIILAESSVLRSDQENYLLSLINDASSQYSLSDYLVEDLEVYLIPEYISKEYYIVIKDITLGSSNVCSLVFRINKDLDEDSLYLYEFEKLNYENNEETFLFKEPILHNVSFGEESGVLFSHHNSGSSDDSYNIYILNQDLNFVRHQSYKQFFNESTHENEYLEAY